MRTRRFAPASRAIRRRSVSWPDRGTGDLVDFQDPQHAGEVPGTKEILAEKSLGEHRQEEIRLGLEFTSPVTVDLNPRPFRAGPFEGGGVGEGIAGEGQGVEADLGDLGQHEPHLEVGPFPEEQPTGLRHPLEDEGGGHERKSG